MTSAEKIYFEQPLNEHTRVCLRLESIFQEMDYFSHDETNFGSIACTAKIVDALTILDRPDLRAKIAKELVRYQSNLLRIEKAPNIDKERLNQLLKKLEQALVFIHNSNGKFAQTLRENEFLTNIRQHLGTPGGMCLFDTPALHLWLKKPYKDRQTLLELWINEFHEIQDIVRLFLKVTRESSSPIIKTAQRGFFQASLDPQLPSQLIRIGLPTRLQLFPQISVGRYGISIRFYEAHFDTQHSPTGSDVEFELTCCVF